MVETAGLPGPCLVSADSRQSARVSQELEPQSFLPRSCQWFSKLRMARLSHRHQPSPEGTEFTEKTLSCLVFLYKKTVLQ
jgi:hypothetical protein